MHPVKRRKTGKRSEGEDVEICNNNMALGRCGEVGGRVRNKGARNNGARMEVEKRNVQA